MDPGRLGHTDVMYEFPISQAKPQTSSNPPALRQEAAEGSDIPAPPVVTVSAVPHSGFT